MRSPAALHALNVLGLLGVTGVLAVAFFMQLAFGELPCPLCLLQRAGFIAVGLGFLLNVRFGSMPAHYGGIVVSAIAGAAISLRQVLLHVVPGTGAYGSALFGLHLYTWAFIGFMAASLYAATLLMLEGRNRRFADHAPGWIGTGAVWLFAILIAANVVSVLLECSFGPCDDNPTYYHLLGK